MSEQINETTGEIVTIDSGDNLGAELSQMGHGNAGVYSSLKSDTFDDKLRVAQALGNSEPLADNLNKPIAMRHVVIQPVMMKNDETGVLQNQPRVVILADDGKSYHVTSPVVYRTLKTWLGVLGEPSTWPSSINVTAYNEKAAKGKFINLKFA